MLSDLNLQGREGQLSQQNEDLGSNIRGKRIMSFLPVTVTKTTFSTKRQLIIMKKLWCHPIHFLFRHQGKIFLRLKHLKQILSQRSQNSCLANILEAKLIVLAKQYLVKQTNIQKSVIINKWKYTFSVQMMYCVSRNKWSGLTFLAE